MKLFLDDLHEAPDDTWSVVRSYDDAVALVQQNGFPEVVSFDHDLGTDKNGYDFAHFLVNLDLDTGTMPDSFSYIVHSANPVGCENITGLLDRYLQWKCDGNSPADQQSGESLAGQ